MVFSGGKLTTTISVGSGFNKQFDIGLFLKSEVKREIYLHNVLNSCHRESLWLSLSLALLLQLETLNKRARLKAILLNWLLSPLSKLWIIMMPALQSSGNPNGILIIIASSPYVRPVHLLFALLSPLCSSLPSPLCSGEKRMMMDAPAGNHLFTSTTWLQVTVHCIALHQSALQCIATQILICCTIS